jgi:cation:H+ antiporter
LSVGSPIYSLAIGLVCVAIGGELFIKGVVGFASWLRIPTGIVGVTIVAFATSSPELAVAISSSLAHSPEIALGNALGSNMSNIAVILAIVATMSGVNFGGRASRRDYPITLVAQIILLVVAYDGQITRLDGIFLLTVFIVWLVITTLHASKARSAVKEAIDDNTSSHSVFLSLAGLGLLIYAGDQIVVGAEGVGELLGLDTFVVGCTMVAVGTTLPELATVVISKLRGHEDVGVGTVFGSTIFNTLLIVGLAACFYPISVSSAELLTGLVFCGVALLVILPFRHSVIPPKIGWLLLGVYILYMASMLSFRPGY